MSQFGKIDNPAEASFEAWPQEEKNLGDTLSGLALKFAGFEFGPAKITQILKDQFSTPSRIARIEYLLNEAVSAACEEAARATNQKKIEQFSWVLVGSLSPNEWADPIEDVAVIIRDIAQLGDRDLRVLGILAAVHASAIATAPNLYEPDAFSRETAALMRDIRSSGIHSDDFLSTCERLRGFGLAAEVLRNIAHMAPHDYCYRPTRRGLAVLDYLKVATSAKQPQGQ